MKTFTSLMLIVFLILAGLGASCNKGSFDTPLEAAKDIGALTDKAIDTIRKFYEQKAITLEKKNKFARSLLTISRGGKDGNETLIALYEQFKTPSKVPADKWNDFIKALDSTVINPFLSLLEEIASLDPELTATLQFSISRIRNIVELLASLIGNKKAVQQLEQIQQRMARTSRASLPPRSIVIFDGVFDFATAAIAQIAEQSPTIEDKINESRANFGNAIKNAERLLDE